MTQVASPCTGQCCLDRATDRCTGCGRTMAEIQAWPAMTEFDRARLVETLLERKKEELLF